MTTFNTCRFCGGSSHVDDGMVQYGVRHHAHFKCYLDAGKKLDALHAWQIDSFPYVLLKQRGLLKVADRIIKAKA